MCHKINQAYINMYIIMASLGIFLTVKVIIYAVYSKDLGHSFQSNVYNIGKIFFKCADLLLGDSSQSKNSKLFSLHLLFFCFFVFFPVSMSGFILFYPSSCMIDSSDRTHVYVLYSVYCSIVPLPPPSAKVQSMEIQQ